MLNIKKLEEKANDLLNKAPGVSVSIFTNDDVLLQKGFGTTNAEEQGESVTPSTLFRIGSVSKTITATLMMRLVEAGKVDLDVPIITYLPELKLKDKQATETITLRMLLSHTAGLPDGGDLFGDRSKNALKNYVNNDLPNLDFVAPPTVHYSYGNHAINLAGYVTERVTGKLFADLIQEEVFEPLSMSRSMYDPLKAFTYPTALQHERKEDGSYHVMHSFPENVACHPSSMAISNAEDMTKFGQMYLNNGIINDSTYLSTESLNQMFAVEAKRYTIPPCTVGICWLKEEENGVEYVWHSGGIGTYRSFMVLFPKHKIGIFTVANQDTGWEIVEEVLNQIGQKEERSFQSIEKGNIENYFGTYLSPKSGLITLGEESNNVFANLNGKIYSLRALQEDHVVLLNEEEDVVASIGLLDQDDYIMVNGSGCKSIVDGLLKHSMESFQTYTGTYKHGEFEIQFKLEKEKAYLEDEDGKVACSYLFESKFYCPGFGLVEFENEKMIIQRGWTFTKT
ncbi:CubicO group peptidase (beta-lactamase class C family) [Salirhabdus euzebyi]|uniref:CubicO group peptidase (Beta-lactamase class C family) n=1 Tax=Salirhabdus euzebyi TaxID=394506 RepID=A0A841Q579_9BACI|nr:serine hydrolase domain-containing protein [Salirhabdus euzebyi]MBB6453548.1 CubicO group peptidase (beta-lactamase class C family) [Salirhabdus euzebyi]